MRACPLRSRARWIILAGLLGGALATPAALAAPQVIVRATATPDYAAQRAAALAADPEHFETYVFMEGRRLDAGVGDASLEKMSFVAIAETLGQELRGQRYAPAKDAARADLILVVHWGMTPRTESDLDLYPGNIDALNATLQAQASATDSATTSALEAQAGFQALAINTDQQGQRQTAASTAALLGLQPRSKMEERRRAYRPEQSITALTAEERYFVVVMAYDARTVLKQAKLRLCWSSRMSISAPGVNFPTAVQQMSLIAGPTLGTQQDDLVLRSRRERQTEVKVGEPRVVPDEADRPPE